MGKLEPVGRARLAGVRADDGVIGIDLDITLPRIAHGVDLGEQAQEVVAGDGFLPEVERAPVGAGSEVGQRGVMATRRGGNHAGIICLSRTSGGAIAVSQPCLAVLDEKMMFPFLLALRKEIG